MDTILPIVYTKYNHLHLAGGCHFTGIALCSSRTRRTRKYNLSVAHGYDPGMLLPL